MLVAILPVSTDPLVPVEHGTTLNVRRNPSTLSYAQPVLQACSCPHRFPSIRGTKVNPVDADVFVSPVNGERHEPIHRGEVIAPMRGEGFYLRLWKRLGREALWPVLGLPDIERRVAECPIPLQRVLEIDHRARVPLGALQVVAVVELKPFAKRRDVPSGLRCTTGLVEAPEIRVILRPRHQPPR